MSTNIKDMSAYFVKAQLVNMLGLSKRYLYWHLPDILAEVACNANPSLSFTEPPQQQGQLISLADYVWLKAHS